MQVDVQNTTVLSADGSSIKLGDYSGEVILIVNVASYCGNTAQYEDCLLYTSPSPRDAHESRMPSSA